MHSLLTTLRLRQLNGVRYRHGARIVEILLGLPAQGCAISSSASWQAASRLGASINNCS